MGAMSACIGMINSRKMPESQYNFDSETNFTLGEKRKRFRLQQRSNSQVFVPIKKEDEFLILSSNEDNKNKSDEKKTDNNILKQNEKFIFNNKEKKIKLRGKNNVCIKKKILNYSDESEDIIDCEDEFDDNYHMSNSIKNVETLNGKRVNYLPKLNPSSSNLNNIKIIRQENGKEDENEIINNNGILNDSYNKDLNMELSVSKNRISPNEMQRSTIFGNLINNNEENGGGKTLENEKNKEIKKEENKIIEKKNSENKILVIQDYYEGGITNLKATNNNTYKIIKANNISFTDNNKEFNKNKEENNIIKNERGINVNFKENKKTNSDNAGMNSTIKKPNKSNKKKNSKNMDFNDCKIENNINFNIDNCNSNMNSNNKNNLNNINNINNFNNISSINYDPNNNNFNDISSTMTYFLSLEKSQRKPASSRFDGKVLSLHKNAHMNYNGKLNNNNYRNSVRVNKYKWKLLPKHKYNTQIYKSLINIPLSKDGQSLFMNDEDQKYMNLTSKYNNRENNEVISEIQKRGEQQDKIIKSLENKINNLEKKINEDKTKEEENTLKITKLEEYMDKNTKKNKEKKMNKENSVNSNYNANISQESQKDEKIKKLEEQLDLVKKNNKLNKTLLKQKDKQIQNLIHSKTKQDERIKQYEYLNNTKPKHENIFQNYTNKSSKKINLLEEISNYNSNSNNHIISITNTNNTNANNNNLTDSKLSLSGIKNNKNLNITTNMKPNQFYSKDIILEKDKLKKTQTKENSLIIKKKFFKSNTSKYSNCIESEQENINSISSSKRASMKEANKLNLKKNPNQSNKSNNKYNLSTKNTSNISYYNYCNDLSNKTKNNYNTKITLNKMKIYKLNTSLSLTLNSDTKMNKYLKQQKKESKPSIKEEMNLEMNMIPNTTKTERKKFSFNKSKKLRKKGSEKDFREMYLKEGTVKNEESSSNNNNSNTFNDNNEIKLFNYNDILNQKATFINSNINNTSSNKNMNNNNENNTSLSPNISSSNFPNKISSINNTNLEDKLNLSKSINNIYISNPNGKSDSNMNSNDNIDDINKNCKELWNQGFIRYKQLNKNKQKISNVDKNLLSLKFCMANNIYEIFVDKEEMFEEVKNAFFELFFKEKKYGEKEKKYIDENIIFLKKDGIIDVDKNVYENNFENDEVIVPVLKDVIS